MNQTYLIGDTHGMTVMLESAITKLYRYEKATIQNDIFIVLGDFSANFWLDAKDNRFKRWVNLTMENCNSTLFAIRGNHEQRAELVARANPVKWHKEFFCNGYVWVEDNFPRIKYAMDGGGIYNINGYSALVLPGAYSVDKWHRLANGGRWFPQEQMSKEEKAHIEYLIQQRGNKFDLILSHTCPILFQPTDLFIGGIDQSMVDSSMERWLQTIENKVNYKLWAFGHYHANRIYPGYDGHQQVMLDCYGSIIHVENYMREKEIKYICY